MIYVGDDFGAVHGVRTKLGQLEREEGREAQVDLLARVSQSAGPLGQREGTVTHLEEETTKLDRARVRRRLQYRAHDRASGDEGVLGDALDVGLAVGLE